MDCDQCKALKRVLGERERIYMNAKARFNATGWRMDSGSFGIARTQVQDARMEFEIAKIEFDRHQRTHEAPPSGLIVRRTAGRNPLAD